MPPASRVRAACLCAVGAARFAFISNKPVESVSPLRRARMNT